MKLFFRTNPYLEEEKIVSLVGEVLYDFGLYSDKVSWFGRYKFPLRLASPPLLVGGWLKLNIDTLLLPKAVFLEDLQDERLLTALRVATGRNVETRFSQSVVMPHSLLEKPANSYLPKTAFDFWYLIERDKSFLRGIPRFIPYSLLPSPSALDFTTLPIPFGFTVANKFQYYDLSQVVGLLISGVTRSGKSVWLRQCLNYLASSGLPFRGVLGDFKFGVEFGQYANHPLFTVASSAPDILSWVSEETQRRFRVFKSAGVRDILSFNACVDPREQMNYVIVAIDEYASFKEMLPREDKVRAEIMVSQSAGAGIHWFVSTQRPTVDVITGTFKAQLGSRMSFSLSSLVDTTTVFDRELPQLVRVGNKGRFFAEIEDNFFEAQSVFV